MKKINYAEFGREMSKHDRIEHQGTQPGQMSFTIPEKSLPILKHISGLLDEYGMEVNATATTDDGIAFSVVTQ